MNLFQLTRVSHNAGFSRNQNACYAGNVLAFQFSFWISNFIFFNYKKCFDMAETFSKIRKLAPCRMNCQTKYLAYALVYIFLAVVKFTKPRQVGGKTVRLRSYLDFAK